MDEDAVRRMREMAIGGSKTEDVPGFINEKYMKVFISRPSADGSPYVGVRPSEFGPVSETQAKDLQIEFLDRRGNLIPAPFLDKHMWSRNGQHRLPDEEAVPLARKILREQNIPVDIWPKKVAQEQFRAKDGKWKNRTKLRGDEQFQPMPHGTKRIQTAQYENPIATGSHKGDYQVIFSNAVYYGWRKRGDQVDIKALRDHYTVTDENGNVTGKPQFIAVTSSSNASHSSEFIEKHKEEWGSADKRLKGRTSESVSDKIPEVYVTFPNGCQFDAEKVLRYLADTEEAAKLREGPNEDNMHIPINVRNAPGHNNWDAIENVHAEYPKYLREIAGKYGMYAGPWASTEAGNSGELKLTGSEKKALFDRYRNDAPARVAFKGALVPIDNEDLIAETASMSPQDRMKNFPKSHIMLTVIGEKGGKNGSQRVMSSYGGSEKIPTHGAEQVRAFYTGDYSRIAPALTKDENGAAMPAQFRTGHGVKLESIDRAETPPPSWGPNSPTHGYESEHGTDDEAMHDDLPSGAKGMVNTFQMTPAPTPAPTLPHNRGYDPDRPRSSGGNSVC